MSRRFLILWFAAVLGLCAHSRHSLRAERDGRCDLDGRTIERTAKVERIDADGTTHAFCGVDCARAWPVTIDAASPPRFVVRSEVDGAALDPALAVFVHSRLPGDGPRGRWRAFPDVRRASEHAHGFGGTPAGNPFDVPSESDR